MSTFKLTLSSTVAAMMALLCAYALGWQHAWWAAMTVWLVIQPNRNLMAGRILARSLGSSLGAIMGAVLILFVTPLSMQLLCLGIWLLISSGLGSLFQQYRNYAFVVAGYTAAIVIMFCYFENNPDVELAYTRIFCTFIGVFFCILWVLPFVPQQKHHHAFENLHSIQGQIQSLFEKGAVPSLEPKIQSFCFEIKRLNQYFQFHQALTKKDNPQHLLHSLIQQLSLIQVFTQPKTRSYFIENKKEVSIHRLPLKQRLKYFFRYFALNQQARHVLQAIVRVIGVYLLTLTLWLATDWKQAPLMVMTAILFAALFSSHAYAQQALTDVLKGSLLGAILGLIFRIFIVPMHDSGWVMLALFMILLLGAYLMNQSKTAKMAIDLNMTFLLIAQLLAQVSQQTPDILLECLAILSGIVITFIWFRTGVPSLFRAISPDRHFAVKLMYALKNLNTYLEFIYLAALMRADIYTRILEQNQTAHELEAALHVLKQICVVEVENMSAHTFQQSGLQALIQAVAQQHHLQYTPVQGEQSHVL
ncbi:p-hydroxybenzoic acid efflux pump subunit AaeB [Acinetobacter baylyi]|uniref:p-hydroxybenzoic acid efflux pump subunit AaeB n=1 Tax=Acinetobacter baylyi TaxID=202950 RepID=A0ABU0UXP3_ACIBI|nr:FUSC family protein [Acinetobacter baylyi]MDQ1209332.1 p-hydroxybenzoic acid efflux pump subunit AaeB [Acinetobacter baylyi]MDR6107075.1 p-hydroxybenzoic acid efflux pump subunit AaeB [Acinetobacter baylyi]MDR6186204.1 p-hydroxybenzoic acid efflux pump subunit AaeB [Acinetobacter baylyi]